MTRRAARPGADPATLRLRPPAWTRHAACDQHPTLQPAAWDDATDAARRVCATCPVRLQCARYALDNALPGGLWGGLDDTDRHQAAADYGFPRPGTPAHGTYARYAAYGCRCPSCTEAKRRYMADRTAKIGAAAHGRRSAA